MKRATSIPVPIDPAAYVEMFEGRQPAPEAMSGVCGRVVRGRQQTDFERLAYADGRRLAWITGPAGLRGMIGRSGADIVDGIGKSSGWLREKLAEGMRWRLIVMPQAVCARADWAGVFEMVGQHYPEVAAKVLRWREALQDPTLAASIDPHLVLGEVKDSAAHPDHMSLSRYRDCPDTALNARLFLWHSLGLNGQFVGDGWTRDERTGGRVEEFLTGNVSLAELPDHRVIDLHVAA